MADNNFSALFRAELDMAKLKEQVSKVQNQQFKLTNFSVETGTLINQIQSALNKKRFNINIGDSVGGNKGSKNFLNEYTAAYNDLIKLQSRINSTRVKLSGLDATKDSKQIAELSSQLNRLMADYNNINAAFSKGFSTAQIDNLRNGFAKTDAQISALNAKLADTSALNQEKQAAQEVQAAFSKLIGVEKEMRKLEVKIGGLSSTNNVGEIEIITEQLNRLRETYRTLQSELNGNLSHTQMESLMEQSRQTEFELERLDAKLADTKQRMIETIQANVADGGSVGRFVAEATAQYERLGATGHSQLTVVKTDIEELRALQESMKTATGDELVSQYTRFEETLSRVKNNLATISAESRTFASSLQITTLDNKIAAWMDKNSRASRDFGASIQELRARLAQLNASGTATASQLNAIEREFNGIKQSAIAAGKTGQTVGDIFRSSFGVISRYISASLLIYRGIAAVKQMYNNVLDVDTAMTGLYRVTNLTTQQYERLYDEMIDSAQRYGATLKDVINLTTSWVKLGYDSDTAKE